MLQALALGAQDGQGQSAVRPGAITADDSTAARETHSRRLERSGKVKDNLDRRVRGYLGRRLKKDAVRAGVFDNPGLLTDALLPEPHRDWFLEDAAGQPAALVFDGRCLGQSFPSVEIIRLNSKPGKCFGGFPCPRRFSGQFRPCPFLRGCYGSEAEAVAWATALFTICRNVRALPDSAALSHRLQ